MNKKPKRKQPWVPSIKEIIKKKVDEDPITKRDLQTAIRKGWITDQGETT